MRDSHGYERRDENAAATQAQGTSYPTTAKPDRQKDRQLPGLVEVDVSVTYVPVIFLLEHLLPPDHPDRAQTKHRTKRHKDRLNAPIPPRALLNPICNADIHRQERHQQPPIHPLLFPLSVAFLRLDQYSQLLDFRVVILRCLE